MNKQSTHKHLFLAALVGSVTFTVASPASASPTPFGGTPGNDDRQGPLETKRRAKRAKALEDIMGGAPVYGKTHEVAHGQFVELERQSEDGIWTVLGEFGEIAVPFFGPGVGPLHNEIAEPDRDFDNTTYWVGDFSQSHYDSMLFSGETGANSMRNYYTEQSSGRYSVHGSVEDWVALPYNAAYYGANWCGDTVCWTTWWFIQDTVNGWYDRQIAAGMTAEEIDEYLAQFDHWDRYDYDDDGDFDEPDGYIDHFQAVHAGEGEEAGGGAQGDDAIWSHSWYVQLTPIYGGGPVLPDGTQVPYGGVQIGNSRFWIGDYTIQPENGGVGVFAHEFGHDLGLPDLYDTAGGDNSTAFWTLMSAGSWMGPGIEDLGTAPVHMGAWEKLQLGWLNYEVAQANTHSTHKLGPAETNTKQAQALIVVLPNKQLTEYVGDAYEGDYFYFSGSDDNLDNIMYRSFNIEPGSTLTAMVNYDIEVDWDYAYLFAYSPTYGWINLETNLSTDYNPNNQNQGYGITGNSGGWTELTADLGWLPAGDWYLGFWYWTDVALTMPGIMIDEIQVTGYEVDGGETEPGWTYDGFMRIDGNVVDEYFNAYVAEFRQHVSYDDALRTGPYNFGFLDDPDLGYTWVEHFPYQEGLLIHYWDTSYKNNNTSMHPGGGLILPIDAHPEALVRADGVTERSRVQTYDSPFGLEDTDPITLHWYGEEVTHPSLPAVSVFDDENSYWNPETPLAGVQNPHTGTQIWINSISAHGSFMQVQVN